MVHTLFPPVYVMFVACLCLGLARGGGQVQCNLWPGWEPSSWGPVPARPHYTSTRRGTEFYHALILFNCRFIKDNIQMILCGRRKVAPIDVWSWNSEAPFRVRNVFYFTHHPGIQGQGAHVAVCLPSLHHSPNLSP